MTGWRGIAMMRRLLVVVLVTGGVTGTLARAADRSGWLEIPDSVKTQNWVGAQEKRFTEVVPPSGYRDEMHVRLRELLSYDLYGIPVQAGGRVFYTKSAAGGSKTVVYSESAGREPQAV